MIPNNEARLMVNDARLSLETRVTELKEQLAQEQGWGTPDPELVERLNQMIAVIQRSLENLPQLVDND